MLESYLGKKVFVKIDRPLGSRHPKHNYVYPLNYGYVPGTKAPDGEEIDAYILGEFDALTEYQGTVIAIVHRRDDIEDKLIVSNMNFSLNEIQRLVHFQEQYFNTEIILKSDYS